MEVSIFEAVGLPEGAILSVRAGATRRQAPVPLAGPLRFPNLPFNAKQFKVDVMQSLGSSKVEINANKELESYSVAVDIGNGQQARVGFTVREQPALCGKRASELKQVDKNPDGYMQEPVPADLPPEKAKAALDSRSYAREHNIPNLVQEMLQAVLRDKPDAPFLVMSEYFKRKGEEMGESSEGAKWIQPGGAGPPVAAHPPPGHYYAAPPPGHYGHEQTMRLEASHQPSMQRNYTGDYYQPNVPGEDPMAVVHKTMYGSGMPDPCMEDAATATRTKASPGYGLPPDVPPRGMPPPVPGYQNKAFPEGPAPPLPSHDLKAAPPPAPPVPVASPLNADYYQKAVAPPPPRSSENDPERKQLEAEHLSLLAERASLLKTLEIVSHQHARLA